jgi:hypothetical protein
MFVAFTASLAVGFAFSAPAPALAETETHSFDASLSLTGGCGTTALDPVPDPGCPEAHAPLPFEAPSRVPTDLSGDLYVLNGHDKGTRIDVFDSTGHWVFTESKEELVKRLGEEFEEFKEPESSAIEDIAVDSHGNLYVSLRIAPQGIPNRQTVIRYAPNTNPPSGETKYGSPFVVFDEHGAGSISVAVDVEDRLYLGFTNEVRLYGAAEDGNALVKEGIGIGTLTNSSNVEVDANGDIFASGLKPGAKAIPSVEEPFVSEIYIFDGTTGELKGAIDGADIPNCAVVDGEEECGFASGFANLDVAIDRETGDVYVSDAASKAAYQFRQQAGGYEFVAKIEHSFNSGMGIAFDNSATSPNRGYLYVTSESGGLGHVYAFQPKPAVGPPIVGGQAVSGLSTSEALLEAELDPNGAPTDYSFEYVTEEIYLADIEEDGAGHGFDHAARAPVPDASLPAGNEPVAVSAALTGLIPATTYRFRIVAENCDPEELERPCTSEGEGKPGGEGTDARFATYPTSPPSPPCPNESLRVGPSAALPDCRAYELVTPPDTNGLPPLAFSIGNATTAWSAPLTSPSGESVLFVTGGGSLPGYNGSGALNADGYRAKRDPASGWQTEAAGPSGVQSQAPTPGSPSPDGDDWVWRTFEIDEGTLGPDATYLRGPDRSFELVGQGSFGEDPQAQPRWVSAGAGHIVFTSAAELEEAAPPSGITAIYDRSPGGPTHVVSLLPGDVTPGVSAAYDGASADGSVVAFKLGETLYVRIDDAETLEVTSGASTFAGLSEDGSRLFYVKGGDIFAFDTTSDETVAVGSGGESTPVNVSADGSHVYFVSPKVLDEAEEGIAGKDNLYVWDGAGEAIHFIAVLMDSDVTGEELIGGKTLGGLGLWTSHAVSPDQGQFRGRSSDPSRTTPDGTVFVFESHANLTGYDAQGHREVYRYDAGAESLICVSCDPTLAPPAGDTELVHLFDEGGILNPLAELANVSADGKRVFFESVAALVPTDVNGARDVYEWRAAGLGGCQAPDGCLALISSGQSRFDSFLYAVTPDAHDVFIRTTDMLVARDKSATPSIYDARVGGGFPEGESALCTGEACKASPSGALSLSGAGSAAFQGPGNHHSSSHCPKGSRKVRHAGKSHCMKKRKRGRHRKHRQAGRTP